MQLETVNDADRLVLIPANELKKLLADSQMLADIRAYDSAKIELKQAYNKIIPFELLERRIAGESHLKIWREYHKITQEKLAEISGISKAVIKSIEDNNRRASIFTLTKLSSALNVSLAQLV